MESTLKRLPWKTIRQAAYYGRRAVFGTKKPDVSRLKVHMDVEHVENVLRRNNMRSGWLISYHYHGEDANLVKPIYFPEDSREHQLHIRLFDNGDGTCELIAHTELCPINHPGGHIRNVDMSIVEGLAFAEEMLEEEGIERTPLE